MVDLSATKGHGINKGVPSNLCSLSYASVDDAVRITANLGQDTQLAKINLKDVYCIVPVHPQDYVDKSLTMLITSAVAESPGSWNTQAATFPRCSANVRALSETRTPLVFQWHPIRQKVHLHSSLS